MSRIDKVNENIRREISTIIQRELADPRVAFVSITSVSVSKDLQHAKVFFSVFGETVKLEEAQKGLDAARGLIRKLVGKEIKMRFNPELIFIYDQGLEYRQEIEATLREIGNESEERS